MFVAAELLKRDIQTSVTFGNAKAIDLLAHNPRIDHTFPCRSKHFAKTNYFLINRNRVHRGSHYVFVLLNKPGESVRYFIVHVRCYANEADRLARTSASDVAWNPPEGDLSNSKTLASLRQDSCRRGATVTDAG